MSYANGEKELYDHKTDPYEWTNLASRVEHKETITKLKSYLPKKTAPEVWGKKKK